MEPTLSEPRRSPNRIDRTDRTVRPERPGRTDETDRTGRTPRADRPADATRIPVVSTSPTTASGMRPRPVTVAHQHLVMFFGEAFLVWRCLDCGATGDLEAFPSACPDCGSVRESLYYYVED